MNKNLKNKNEQGRSMVEMLGVLAVIGVLSVAGIAGYSIAMRSHRTNEVLNAASKLYVMAMAKNQGNGADTNYTELGTPPTGTTLSYSASDKNITITFPDQNDCAMALNKLGDKASANTCSTSPATITVTFGETTTQQETNNEEPDPNNCTEGNYYCNSSNNYTYGCFDGSWETTSDYCPDGCKDNYVHSSESDTCLNNSLESL